uniref:G-protein coupled receptors family 1 profile domain-containing protein n=1 Tax=Mola mola TaxID=94237 RepID=A0A3Q4BLG4_MOLML
MAKSVGFWLVPSSIHPLSLSQLSPSADLAVALFLILTGNDSMLGNGTLLLVCCRKRKKLRPHQLMTLNLALCKSGFSLLGAPFFNISSLCQAWVFGETGCLWYSIQGFVFGTGSLLATCLISVGRCLKICSLRYGQCIEKRHVSLFIVLMWVYTLFWAFLFTINWWRIRSSLSYRIYIFLILILCYGFPCFTIVTSYFVISVMVYRSNRTQASIPSSSVSHISKDLRLVKVKHRQGSLSLKHTLQDLTGQPTVHSNLSSASNTVFSSSLDSEVEQMTSSPQPFSSLPPVITLIPAMFAKSLCVINPLIFQIMNREFRGHVYVVVFGQETEERRRAMFPVSFTSLSGTISFSYFQSWRRKRSSPPSLSEDRKHTNLKIKKVPRV